MTNQILFLLFLLSGFCGLLYQVVWLRLAFASFGVITPVLSVVVSVFMAGLALGSWGAGKGIGLWSRRSGWSAIYFYALAEGIIGLSALVVPLAFEAGRTWLLPLGEMNSLEYLVYSGLVLGLSIMPACVAMGATFPLALAFIKENEPSENYRFSFLYLANVIGASLGASLTAVVFVELLGFRATLLLAALLNFSIAVTSVWLGMRHRRASQPAAGSAASAVHARGGAESRMSSSRAVLSLVILFTTGLCSMGLEVIWTRAFTTVLGTYVYSFALLLFTYLWATWLGSWIYRRDIRNGSVAATPRMLAILGIAGLLPIVLNDPRVGPRSMMLVLSSIIPFCATLGYLTPKLIDQYSNGQPRGAGRAYAVNVVGCILGPLVAGYMLLPTLGARHSMTFLTVPFLVLFATFWTSPALTAAWRGVTGIASAALLACATFVSLSYEEGPAWTRAEIRRDYTATVVSFGEGMRKQLVVNGVGITSMTPLTKLMAHLPLAIHGRAQSVAVICLGMGTTFRSALSWDVNTTAVELAGSVRDAFPYYFDDAFKLMDDPRGRIVIDDGRRFLQRTTDRFDIVTIDPPPPLEAAGSSLLYSKEFYEIVKTRLNDGGILQHWSPGGEPLIQNAIARSLIEAFGYVTAFRAIEGGGIHYVASMQPFRIPSVDDFVARLPQAAQQDLIEWNEGELRDVRVFAGMVLDKQIGIQELLYPDPDVVITDDRPFNEYYWLRRNVGRDLRPDWALAGS